MCNYHYIYASTCRHADFYRISYCDRAKALGLPRQDSHSPNGDSADNTLGDLPGPSSSQPPASSVTKDSSSHSHSQQHSHNMSTLTHSGAGTSFTQHATLMQRDEQLLHNAALIPRSAFNEDDGCNRGMYNSHVSGSSDPRDYHNVNIDISLGPESSMSMEVTHDGKVTQLVARFESYAGSGSSDAIQESHDDHIRESSMSAHQGSMSNAGTVRGPPSPRKPIPSQWLPVNNGPRLATAQRAKERGHKRDSVSGSPVETKTLRGSRSFGNMSKGHGAEVPTFLTKETLAAVETDITSPTNARSPTKRPLSKPAWQSPTSSPLRESPRQQPAITTKMSPSKTALLSADAASLGHIRGPSSVATSTREPVFNFAEGSIFHSAEGSPVRSTAGFEPNFKSTAEVLEDYNIQIPHLQLSADSKDEQKSGTVHTSAVKAATVGRASSSRPRLQLDTALSSSHTNTGDQSSTSLVSATSSSTASNSPWSPTSASSASRIPRAPGTNAATARGPTRSSTLKRAHSVKSLRSQKTKSQDSLALGSQQSPRLASSSTASKRHVRTVNDLGTTPILSRKSTIDHASTCNIVSTSHDATDMTSAQRVPDLVEQVSSLLGRTRIDVRHEASFHEKESYPAESSRASSMCTVKATPPAQDPVMLDSAIIYSKKLGASGTLRLDDAQDDIASMAASGATNEAYNTSPIQGRAEQFAACGHRKAESIHSLQSSLVSDLRATAPEFVPQPPPASEQDNAEIPASPPIDTTTDLLGFKAFELDIYGIPWFYYMSQVQFAYNQGFQYGRSRSPKKFRTKKNRPCVSSPADVYPVNTRPIEELVGTSNVQGILDMPPAASTLPLAEQRARQQQENYVAGRLTPTENSREQDASSADRPCSPFAAQKEIIAHQGALRSTTNTLRAPNVDLTSIRNVPLPAGPRNMPSQNAYHKTLPSRGQYNSRRYHNRSDNGLYSYGGRGMVGVPMQNIAFPDPVPPQGRPIGAPEEMQVENGSGHNVWWPGYRQIHGSEACGTVDIVIAAERGGGDACNACAPDHPLE